MVGSINFLEMEAFLPQFPVLQGYLAKKNSASLGPYTRTMHRAPWWTLGVGVFI